MVPAVPDDSSPADSKPSSRQAARWSSGITVALILLAFFVPSFMSWKLAILLGAALLAFAGYLARQEHAWLKSARVVPGTVVELIPIKAGKGRTSYTPRIRYTTGDGTVHDFLRPSAPGPAGVAAGDPLAVAYHDATPQDLRIFTFGRSYGYAAFLAVLGIGLMLLGATFLAGNHYVPRVYLPAPPAPAPGR